MQEERAQKKQWSNLITQLLSTYSTLLSLSIFLPLPLFLSRVQCVCFLRTKLYSSHFLIQVSCFVLYSLSLSLSLYFILSLLASTVILIQFSTPSNTGRISGLVPHTLLAEAEGAFLSPFSSSSLAPLSRVPHNNEKQRQRVNEWIKYNSLTLYTQEREGERVLAFACTHPFIESRDTSKSVTRHSHERLAPLLYSQLQVEYDFACLTSSCSSDWTEKEEEEDEDETAVELAAQLHAHFADVFQCVGRRRRVHLRNTKVNRRKGERARR